MGRPDAHCERLRRQTKTEMVNNPSSSRQPEEEVKVDGERFDALLREVASPTSRRRIVGGVLGGVAALVAGTAVIKAKPGKGQTKLSYCHQTGNGSYRFVRVGAPSAHSKHTGDIACTPGVCQVAATGCDKTTGACIFESAPEGTPCDVDPLVEEECDATGACVPVTP
jgi:hypothetical protein